MEARSRSEKKASTDLQAQRFSSALEPLGDPIYIDPEAGANTVIVTCAPDGVLVTWYNNGVKAAFLPAGASATLDIHDLDTSIPAESWEAFGLAATRISDGFLVSWLTLEPNPGGGEDHIVAATLTLGPDGTPSGYQQVLDPDAYLGRSFSVALGYTGDGVDGIGIGTRLPFPLHQPGGCTR